MKLVINHVWFYSVFRWEIETKTTFLTFLDVFFSLILSARISMYGWREPLIHLNMTKDRIEPKMKETIPTENVIHKLLKAWFSISIAPMDSSKSQCLWVTVKAKTKKLHQRLLSVGKINDRDNRNCVNSLKKILSLLPIVFSTFVYFYSMYSIFLQ